VGAIGRIFGRGRHVENLLKKAEEAFGKRELEKCAEVANELALRISSDNRAKYSHELIRAYYLGASSLYKLGRIDEALETIGTALELEDGLGDIAKLLAEMSLEVDKPEVVTLLELAVKRLPDNNYVALALCYQYVEMEKFDEEALPLFKKMYERAPDNTKVIFGLAMTYKSQDKYDRTALAIYRRAFHEFSTNQDLLYSLARTYASQTPPVSESLPVIERALKFFPDEPSFLNAKIAVLANLPVLTPDQVKILVAHYKKTKDKELAEKLVGHLLTLHADDEDACRVYESVWKEHAKRTTLLSILAERYRLAGRSDNDAVEVFQAFFDDMPRERENTLYIARLYAKKRQKSENAILVYQQALKDVSGAEVNDIVLALSEAYFDSGKRTEEAGRIYRMAHEIEPENYMVLEAIRDIAMAGGRMDGTRADALIHYIKHDKTTEGNAQQLAEKLGPVLAKEGRTDEDACNIYRINVERKKSTKEEEQLLAATIIEKKKVKKADIPLLERVYERQPTDKFAIELARLYRETDSMSEKSLPVVVRALELNPGDRELAGWSLAYILNQHGQDEKFFPLLASLIAKGHLQSTKDVRTGVVAQTATRIARDKIRESKFKEAIEILSEAFKFDHNPILQYLLGVSYQGSGDIQTGLGIFKDLLKSDKQNPAYSYRIAVMKLMESSTDESKKELDKLAKLFPDHPMVHLRLGMIMESDGDHDAALKEYEQVKSGDKAVVAFAEYRRGILLGAKGEWEGSLKLLDRAFGGGVKSPALETARLIARTILVDEDTKKDKLESAERKLGEIMEHRTPPWSTVANERLLRLGILYMMKGDEKSAQRVLETAMRTGVRNSRVSTLLGIIDIDALRPKAALERLDRNLNDQDKFGSELAHRVWTVINLKLARHDEARDAAEWLIARKVEDAPKLRFLGVWRNPVEVDWPAALSNYTYENLEKDFGFPIGMIGRMAYKRADYDGGAKYLEKYFKDEKKPDRIEAEFLLGLMYIKQKKPNLGLHYWSHILTEGYKELSGKQRIDALMLLGYHFLEHGEPEKSREAFKLAGEAGAEQEDIDKAVSFSHLQAGYMAAKSDNMQGAIREWEKILETRPESWQALQNLGIAHFWMGSDEKSREYFDRLFVICEENPSAIDEEEFTFVFEETRKMINQLVSLSQVEPARAEVKREMTLDEIQNANRNYWTLGVKKGVTSEEAQANYFRLVKIYNPEKYPRDFMVLEKAYEFFNKPGLLKKNEQVVFNAFHFRQLGLEAAGGLTEIPPSPQVVEFIRKQLDPRNHFDLKVLLNDSLKRQEKLPELNTSPDYAVADYLASW